MGTLISQDRPRVEVSPVVPATAPTGPGRWLWAMAYGLPSIAAALATQAWFSPGRFIAAGDVSPFLRGPAAAEIGWLWTHQTTGAGSASTEIARAFEVAFLWLVGLLGGSDLVAQRAMYAVLLGMAAFGVAYFAGGLTRRPVLVACCGLLGAFNPLVLISNFNPVLLAPVGLLGVLGGLLLRAASGERVSAVVFALATVGMSYVALNPPALAVVIGTTVAIVGAASLLVGPGGTRRAALLLLRAAPLSLVLNIWWIVPVGLALFGPSGAAIAAETDVTQWAWTHADNSLWNVAALNAHWTWRFPEYLPASALLDHPVWVWMRYGLPAVALAAPFVATPARRRGAVVIALAAVGLIVVGKGLHAPFGGFNTWLYANVPGFWLLREPLNKIGPVILLCYVVLLVTAVESIWERTAGRRTARSLPRVLVVGSICAALIYPWPIYTGDVVPAHRPPLPGARVAVPDGWREAAAAVNSDPTVGKAMVLPLNPYYQMTTDWGYHGVDTVAQQLLHRPVIQRLPGGYFSESGGFDGLTDAVERSLIDGDVDALPRLLKSLAVSHLLVRNDLAPGQSGRPVADQERLAQVAHAAPGMTLVGDFGVVSVFRVRGDHGIVNTYQQAAIVDGFGSDPHTSRVLRHLPATMTVTTEGAAGEGASRASGLLAEGASTTTTFTTDSAGWYDVTRESDGTLWDVHRSSHSIELREQLDVQLNDRPVTAPRTVSFPADREALLVAVPAIRPDEDAQAVTVIGSGERVRLQRGGRVAVLGVADASPLRPSGPVGDCNASDQRSHAETELHADVDGRRVRLSARAHSACITAEVAGVEGGSLYQISFTARTSEGLPARLCVWDPGSERCAGQAEVASPRWTRSSVVVAPSTSTRSLEVFLYADGPDDGGRTTTEYRDISVERYDLGTSEPIAVPEPMRTQVHLQRGTHQLTVHQEVEDSTLSPLSTVSDCQRTDDRSADEVGLAAEPIAGGVRLSARDHSACVSSELPDGVLADRYLLEFEHRTLSGAGARTCLWQSGPDRCSVLPELESTSQWSTFRFPIRPLPDARGLEIYFYADGEGGEAETVTEYRDISLRPALSTYVAVTPAGPAVETVPTARAVQHHPGSYTASIDGIDGPFVLTLADSFDHAWNLRELPDSWSARHIKVDGYANGWLVEPPPSAADADASVVIEHLPTIAARRALLLSVGGAAMALLLLLGSWVSRRR